MLTGLACHKNTNHTADKNTDGITTITITHPFHPEQGNEYEYAGQKNNRVRYIDKDGNIRLIPVNCTSLHIPAIGERSAKGSFIAPIDELLELKVLIDRMLSV